MPKAYWIATVNVTNPDQYSRYRELAPVAFEQYGARLLSRTEEVHVMEGSNMESIERCVVFEFPDLEGALACHASDQYRRARKARHEAAEVSIIIVPALEH